MDVGELQAHVAESRRREVELLDIISRIDWESSGYSHLWKVLRDALRISQSEAKRLVRQVELLCPKVGITGQDIEPRLPAARAAMLEGALSVEHVNRIAKIVEQAPDEHAAQVEAELVEAAYQFNPRQIDTLGARILDILDQDAPEPDESVVEAQNQLDIRENADGSLSGRFKLGAESAAHFKPLLSSLTKPHPGDDRTLVERQGDALAEVIRIAADAGKARAEGGERPHIAVTVSLETLQSGIGTAPLDDGHVRAVQARRRIRCPLQAAAVLADQAPPW